MELGGYFAIVRRWWWTLLLAAWIAGLVGFLFAATLEPRYDARVRLLVGPVTADLNTLRASAGLVPTFAELAQSEPLLESVAEAPEVDLSVAELEAALSITANDTTRLLTIHFDDSDPARAAAVPNEVADQLIALQPTGATLPEGEITIIEPATVPTEPAAPDAPLLVVLAAGAGLVGALILVLILEYANHSIRGPSELEALTDVPLIGQLRLPPTRQRWHATSPLFVDAMPSSRAASSLRIAAVKATSRDRSVPLRSLLVIGIDTHPGAGQIAANLAAVIAQAGDRVTLVDANDESAEVSTLLAAVELPGLAEMMEPSEGDALATDLASVVLPRWGGVDVVPRGKKPMPIANGKKVARLLDDIAARSGVAIVNAPPIHQSGTSLTWARACDATILVARREGTRRDALLEALDSLRLVHAEVVGIIMYDRASRLVVPTARWESSAAAGGASRFAPVAPEKAPQAGTPEATDEAPTLPAPVRVPTVAVPTEMARETSAESSHRSRRAARRAKR